MNKVAFLTTIFPVREDFLIDFFDSLSKQTYNKFDVLVVNDGFKNFINVKKKYQNLSITELTYSDTPAKNREYGINYCIEQNYDFLIFGDIDDYFSENRVEECIKFLKLYDVVVNDLSLFNENSIYEKKYISNRINHKSIINKEFIENKNIFGFSNSAVKIKNLEKQLFDNQLVAVDWYFFKQLLQNGFSAIFINTTLSFYRQYSDNIVGLSNNNGEYPLWWERRKKLS